MSDIDIIDKEFDAVESPSEEGLEDVDEKNGKRRTTTRQHLKVRRAIEDHLEKKRFRDEIDYLNDEV